MRRLVSRLDRLGLWSLARPPGMTMITVWVAPGSPGATTRSRGVGVLVDTVAPS
jgi:hypothetical protein